ncbi:MAG: cobalamin-dependent protein [Myxococcales bacterium]|nr:cobalamin-dependent protein [Myxococcales bacterium]
MPTPFETGRLGLENVVWLSEPVALTSIAAAVPEEHEIRLLDLRLEPEDALAKALVDFAPDLVGTTSMTTDVYQAKAVLRMTRQIRPEALTVVGGHAPTLQPQEFEEDYIDVVVQGEGEHTFRELVERWNQVVSAGAQLDAVSRRFPGIPGVRYRDEGGYVVNAKREQTVALDELPAPDRSLVAKYYGRYFFTVARPMASIFTSRGCSFDCNFCAIWEFYERRTRFLSAEKIADQMQACKEDFIFLLDDNFLTSKRRLTELCEELERRKLKKFWMTQGRTDFVADNPELIARLAKNGLIGLLSGFESNDDDSLASLRKKNTWDKNKRANQILRDNGVFSTGIFMVRADWTREQFQGLYDYINTLEIGIPLVTILTPLPGTQLYRAYQDKLLTTDYRLFDLLHAVLPTKLPREEFYQEFARALDATEDSAHRAMKNVAKRRPDFMRKYAKNMLWFYARTWRYQRVHRDYRSFLRDEEGLLNGPGAKAQLTWRDVEYPRGDEHSKQAQQEPGLVKLRIPKDTWVDELPAVGVAPPKGRNNPDSPIAAE